MPSDGLGCTRATMIERESHGRHESDCLEDASKDVSKGWSISSSYAIKTGTNAWNYSFRTRNAS